jgi:hypothetical protein
MIQLRVHLRHSVGYQLRDCVPYGIRVLFTRRTGNILVTNFVCDKQNGSANKEKVADFDD